MQFAEIMFYAEAEGLLPTRTGNINAVIRDVRNDPHPEIKLSDFEKILNRHHLSYDELSERELNYIEARIR